MKQIRTMRTFMLKERLLAIKDKTGKNSNDRIVFDITQDDKLEIYPLSIIAKDKSLYFIAKHNNIKYLYILYNQADQAQVQNITGVNLNLEDDSADFKLRRALLNHENARQLQKIFDFTRPKPFGTQTSIGLGDRLGLANPGHLRAIKGTNIKAILAQQSIRELNRTKRKPEDVMDAAVWAVFQEGYHEGFGADADHLKTTQDIDLMMQAGYTMFTFDPSDYVANEADHLSTFKLSNRAKELPWLELNIDLENLVERYKDKKNVVDETFTLKPTLHEILRAIVKYGGALAHMNRMYQYVIENYSDRPFEIELSVDETQAVTSPFDHYFIANELIRMQIEFISLAPRFIGAFEKGVDYRGDLDIFQQEYIKHMKIARLLGPYKLSFHSGSDKFAVYERVGLLHDRFIHIKTAGTSYLEALRTIALENPKLFREILDFARNQYDSEKKTYHVSADLSRVRSGTSYNNVELKNLLDDDNVRQVLHVTFGRVLTELDDRGKYLFKDRFIKCLIENEDTYSDFIETHFKRHIAPFVKVIT